MQIRRAVKRRVTTRKSNSESSSQVLIRRAGLRHVPGVRPNRAAILDPDYREPEMLQPDAFCEHTMEQNSTAAVAPSPTPLTAYTAPSNNLVGFKGAASQRGERGEEGEQKGRDGGKGEGRLTAMQWWIRGGSGATPPPPNV